MRKGFLASLIVVFGLVLAPPVTNVWGATNHGTTTANSKIKGVNSKKYYTSFKYQGLIDKLKHEKSKNKIIKSTSKVLGNWHWVKVINKNGSLAYTSPHFSKKTRVKKSGYTVAQSVVQIQYDKEGNADGYQYNSLVPVVAIIKVHNKTVFKTFDGVYISAGLDNVKEVNYYHEK